MWRAAGDEEIDGEERGGAVENFRMTDERAACNGAGADGDDDFRGGHGVVSFFESELHIAADGSGDEQAVGVARGGDELDTEPAEIPCDGSEHIRIGLAGVAAAGADLAQAKGAAEEFSEFPVEGVGEADLFVGGAEEEIFAAASGHPVVVGMGDRVRLTDFHTGGAKDAASEVERDGLTGGAGDRFRGADIDTIATTGGA